MSAGRWTQADLAAGWRSLGLRPGHRVVVHSSLRSIGRVRGGAPTVVASCLDAVGPDGLLVAPTFTSEVGADRSVDLRTAESRTGAISEALRLHPAARRSEHPTHSVAAVGRGAEELTRGHLRGPALGEGSPLDRLAAAGGRIVLVGVGHTSNTMIHVAEERASRPKPRLPRHEGPITVRTGAGTVVVDELDPSPSCSAAFGAAEWVLRRHGLVRDGRLGDALCQTIDAAGLLDALAEALTDDPTALLCTRPSCDTCPPVRQAVRSAVEDGRASTRRPKGAI